jgi:DNA-binding MarR family transcriptional regulator
LSTSDSSSAPPNGDRKQTPLALYRVSRTLRNAALPLALTWDKLSALSAIARFEPVSISAISAAEDVSPPTMSRTVAALQRRNLVRCVASREDGRSVLVMTTAKGRAALDKYMTTTLTQIAEALQRLDTADLEDLVETIRKIRDAKS